MRITIESTPEIVKVKGTTARLWRGITSKGVVCNVYVTAVSVALECNAADFEADLAAIDTPPEADELAPAQTINDLIVMIGHAINANNGRWPAVEKALCDLSSAFVDLAPLAPPERR
jgi:hypothetical protein